MMNPIRGSKASVGDFHVPGQLLPVLFHCINECKEVAFIWLEVQLILNGYLSQFV